MAPSWRRDGEYRDAAHIVTEEVNKTTSFVRRTTYSGASLGVSGLRAATLARKVRKACLMDKADRVKIFASREKSNTRLIR